MYAYGGSLESPSAVRSWQLIWLAAQDALGHGMPPIDPATVAPYRELRAPPSPAPAAAPAPAVVPPPAAAAAPPAAAEVEVAPAAAIENLPQPEWATLEPDVRKWYSTLKALKYDDLSIQELYLLAQHSPIGYQEANTLISKLLKKAADGIELGSPGAYLHSAILKVRHSGVLPGTTTSDHFRRQTFDTRESGASSSASREGQWVWRSWTGSGEWSGDNQWRQTWGGRGDHWA